MEQIKLNFFGEIVSVDIPKDLSSLRKIIAKLYSFSEQDASELILTYSLDGKKEIISNDDQLKTFLSSNVKIIDLDISQKSQIYQNNLNQLKEESDKDKKLLDDLIKQKQQLMELKKTQFASEKQQIKEMTELICELGKRKREIIKIIKEGNKQIEKEQYELEKKIMELQKKLGMPVFIPQCEMPKKMIPRNHKIIMFAYPCHMHNNKPLFDILSNQKNNKSNSGEIHHGFICDGCGMRPIVGKRYKCNECHNFDYCEACYEKNKITHKHEFKTFEKSIFRNLHNEIRVEPKKEEKKEIHFGFVCDGCEMHPIIGKRYKCENCKDFDYCEKCYEKNKISHGHKFNRVENKFPKFEKKEIHHFVICDGCKMAPIIGKRYKCKECKDFDFCEKCYEKNKLTHGHGHEFNHIEKPQFHNPFLFRMNPFFFNNIHNNSFNRNTFSGAKKPENIKHKLEHCPTMGNLMNKKVHFGVKCDGCGKFPIVGCRYKCAVCNNFDYCEDCEKKLSQKHGHPLLKIRDANMKVNIIKNSLKK